MQVGDIVDGRYRLLDLLGEGAAGKVFRAEDLGKNNMFVALKLLHAKDPRWENFFRREFEVLSRLHHPNLVSVYDFGPAPEENTWYFTQELVVGKPLLETVAGKKIDDVISMFIEICRALEFIHGHGVLHRDLKPANILVQQHAEPGERVRVLDFGLWRELDTTPQRGARWAGTPPYLASEVLRGFGHSISADLYAVGITLFQVLTRKLPHGRGTPQELLQARKAPAPDLSGMVRKDLAQLISRLLDEEPANRPQTAAEVAALLSQMIPNNALAMPLALGRARLVGRDFERQKLSDLIEAVRERRPNTPRLVVIEGPDGVGKSRFVQELKAEVQLKGGRSAIGACMEDVRFSYRPVAELTRALAPLGGRAQLTDVEKEVVQRLLPELSAGAAQPTMHMGKQERDRFHTAAAELFATTLAGTVCVLIVEDVPYCDPASAALLAEIVRRAREASVLVVVTAATEQQQGAASAVPKEIVDAAGGDMLRLALQPLPREDVAKLACGLLGVPQVPDGFADMLASQARGNPLMVEELLALMIDRGDLRRGDHGWITDDMKNVPSASAPLLGVLSERVQRLSDAERKTLMALAVFNRPSGPKLLAAVSGLDVAEVRQALSLVEGHGLIRVVGEEEGRPRVIFRHPNIKDALVQKLEEKGELLAWHRRCAEVLEARAKGNLSPIAETLAHHFEKAGETKKAIDLYLLAAEHSLSTFAFEDGMTLGRKAARLMRERARGKDNKEREPPLDPSVVRCDLVVGKSMLLAGHVLDARSFFEAAIDKVKDGAAQVGPDAFGELHAWFARASAQLGGVEPALRAVDRALGSLDEKQHPTAAARLLLARAELRQRREPKAALADVQHAIELFRGRAGVDDALRADEVTTSAALWAGNLKKALEAAKRRLALAEKHARVVDEIPAHRALAEALSASGERLQARNHLNTALELAKERSHKVEEAQLWKALGEQLYLSGAYAEAIARFQQAATLSAQTGQVNDRAQCLQWIGKSYVGKGDYDRGLDHLNAAVDSMEKHGEVAQVVSVICDVATALLAKGDVDKADEELKKASKRLPKELGIDLARAELCAAQGQLLTRRGEYKKARDAFLHAVALFRKTHRHYQVADALVGYSQMLLKAGCPRAGLRLSKRAENIFTDLDARGQMKRIAPLINATAGLATRVTADARATWR